MARDWREQALDIRKWRAGEIDKVTDDTIKALERRTADLERENRDVLWMALLLAVVTLVGGAVGFAQLDAARLSLAQCEAGND